MTETPSERYRALVQDGKIVADPAQAALAERLTALAAELENRGPAAGRANFGRLFARRRKAAPPKGLYIHGDVGRGKTMLVDLFFSCARIAAKRRAHFNDFMADVHERIHEFRARLKRGEVGGDDPIAPVAAAFAAETRLLCLDEFHVDDIADAMILGRLFTHLFDDGLVLVATSNAMPRELYANGLNRQLFLPFVDVLDAHVDVVRLDAATDYRLDKLRGADLWFSPLDERSAGMDAAWRRLTGTDRGAPAEIVLKGRTLRVSEAHLGVARFSFADLCEAPLGPNDFLALARAYHTILIDRIPVLDGAHRNEVRRFVLMIDTFYDNGVKLIASAAGEPGELYAGGPLAEEFRRTASRLVEMRSAAYLAAPHGRRHGGQASSIKSMSYSDPVT